MVLKIATEKDKLNFRRKIEILLRKMCAKYKVTSDEIIIKIPKVILIKKNFKNDKDNN